MFSLDFQIQLPNHIHWFQPLFQSNPSQLILNKSKPALNREHGWLISFHSAEVVHFTHKSCFTFLPCTAVVHSQDHTTRHFKSSTYPGITLYGFASSQQECSISMLPLLPQRCSISMLPPRSPPLEPHTTANGDPLISESSLLCQALPIISLVVVLLCRVTWFKNRSLDLQQEQTTTHLL